MSLQYNIAIHPGKILERELENLGVNQAWLATRANVSRKTISQIISGESLISPDMAMRLEHVFGNSAEFWLELSKNYEVALNNIQYNKRIASEAKQYHELLNSKIYHELVKMGYMEPSKTDEEKVKNFMRFFQIDSLSLIPEIHSVAFRRNAKKEYDKYAMAAWLRCGEIEAYKLHPAILYDENRVSGLLQMLKDMSNNSFDEMFTDVQSMLLDCGVKLVTVRTISGVDSNGATRWVGRFPVIQISECDNQDERKWFTLFHEIGHILLHGKRRQFVDSDAVNVETDANLEEEADRFARKYIRPAA